jgi:hypothetical protein
MAICALTGWIWIWTGWRLRWRWIKAEIMMLMVEEGMMLEVE